MPTEAGRKDAPGASELEVEGVHSSEPRKAKEPGKIVATKTLKKRRYKCVDPMIPRRLGTVMLRRRKVDVLPELPAKTYQTIDAKLSREAKKEADAFAALLADRGVSLDEGSSVVDVDLALKTISDGAHKGRIRQALSVAKIKTGAELVEQ